ncbi:hypothetical protein ScPMuIL_000717 [Solemya velum]
MKTIGDMRLTWSALKHLRYQMRSGVSICSRAIYSKTGIWDPNLDVSKKKEIEDYWRPKLAEYNYERINTSLDEKEKFYVLSMFPYPSGKLHMGHVRVYTISDAMARYHRLTGKQVVHPMGWDAFGLPAENAAIERGEMPDRWTNSNIKSMKKQLEEFSYSFDWNRELATCDPKYYRWTQHIFLMMMKAGLVYQKEASVNWDPVDQTVLADEQIDDKGQSWRSGAVVEKRYLRQWYIRTTAYAKSLLDGLAEVDRQLWKDIIALQKHWIGECSGCRFDFKLKHNDCLLDEPISVYTSHPHAIFGVSHISVSPDHRLNQSQYRKEVNCCLDVVAVHPLTKQTVPVIVTRSHVFDEYNDAKLGIPCLSAADADIAKRFDLNYMDIIETKGDNQIVINSEQFSGMNKQEAINAVTEYAREMKIGGHLVSPWLNDWLISRQRYWGTPIPVIHCPKCKAVPVPFDELPVELPKISKFTGKGISPLASDEEWINTQCPKCGGAGKRETDTMDTFLDSSWYFLRYLDPGNTTEPVDKLLTDRFMPVDLYIGGKEHAVLHLYFARFFNHFLCDQGVVKHREPFVNLLTQGMVMGQSFRVKGSGRYLTRDQVDLSGPQLVEKDTGALVVAEWEKMSKSKHNGVDPEDVIGEFGVDSTRLCILANVSPQSNRNWSNEVFIGVNKWQSRVWKLVVDFIEQKQSGGSQSSQALSEEQEKNICEIRNYFLKETSFHFERTFLLSVAISRLQGFTNALKKVPVDYIGTSPQFSRAVTDLVIMISPFAPHFASELWAGLADCADHESLYIWNESVLHQRWPVLDEDYSLPLQIQNNGQDLCELKFPRSEINDMTREEAHSHAKSHDLYQKYVAGNPVNQITFSVQRDYRATIDFGVVSTKTNKEKKMTKAEKKKAKKELKNKKKIASL